MDWKSNYLGKPVVPTWIYSPVSDPNGEFEKTIKAVEQALGFDLFVWQKTYILQGEFRKMGATTAQILADLLYVDGSPIDYTLPPKNERERFYRRELRHIKEKLDDAGIPTRTVWFAKKDKDR